MAAEPSQPSRPPGRPHQTPAERKRLLRVTANFSPEDDGYALYKLYTAASDSVGHSVPIRFNAPPTIVGEISELIASRSLPYRTISEFGRDAMHHRLRYWSENANSLLAARSILDTLSVLEAQQRVSDRLAILNQYKALAGQISDYVRRVKAEDFPLDHISDFLAEMREVIGDMPEPFKGKLLTLMEGL